MKTRVISIAILVVVCAGTILPQTIGPAQTVNSFYKFSNARSALFNRKHIESRKRWYTPDLYRLFLEELTEEEAFLKQNPTEKPFFGDGLSFRPLDEPCEANGKQYRRSQRITRTEAGRNRAYVDVEFAYPKACKLEPVVYRVHLRKLWGKWLVDDWTYSSGMTLTREMKENKYGA